MKNQIISPLTHFLILVDKSLNWRINALFFSASNVTKKMSIQASSETFYRCLRKDCMDVQIHVLELKLCVCVEISNCMNYFPHFRKRWSTFVENGENISSFESFIGEWKQNCARFLIPSK